MKRLLRFLESDPPAPDTFEIHEGLEINSDSGPADNRGSTWDITVLRFGKSKRSPHFVYTRESVTGSPGAFEGAKVYANSAPDEAGHHKDPNKKGPRDIVGVITLPTATDTELRATLNLYPSADWLKKNLTYAFEKKLPLPYELSIDATGRAHRGDFAGETLPIVESFDRVSVDVVERGAAGGRFNRLIESEPHTQHKGSTAMLLKQKLLSIFMLLYPTFLEGKKVDVTAIDENALFTHLLEADKATPRMHLPDGSQLTEALIDDKLNEIREAAARPAPAATPPAAQDTKDLEKRLREQELRTCGAILEAEIVRSKLPAIMAGVIRDEFNGKIFQEADLQSRIKKLQEAFSKFIESAPDNGGMQVRMGTTAIEKVVAGIDGFFLRETRVELTADEKKNLLKGVPPYRSIKEAYIEYTGDKDVTGLRKHSTRLTESLATGDFGEVVASALNKRMVRDYGMLGLDTWRPFVNIVPLSDFKTQRRIRYGGYGVLPTRAQGAPYMPLTSPTDEEATYTPVTKGGTEDLTRELIMNDDVGAVSKIPQRMMRGAAWGLHEFIFTMVAPATTTVTYDGTKLIDSGAHFNAGTAALAADGVALGAARTRMLKQLEKDSGKRLGLRLRYLLVPPDLESIADGLTRPAFGQNNQDPSFLQTQRIVPITVVSWTDLTDWGAVADGGDIQGLELGFINGQETPEIFVSDLANVGSWFTNDKITYKIRHEYGAAITDFRAFDGSVVA